MSESIALGIIIRLKDEASRGVRAALGGIEKLGDEADRTQKRVAKLESGFRQLRDAGLALSGMGIAAGGALFSVIKPAATLEEAIKNTLTLTGKTGDAFARMEEDMTKRALELSTVLGISASDVADSFYQVLSSGAEALSPQFDALAETALKMSKTVGLAPADAVEILSDTLHAFEMDVSKAERVADVFFATSKLTATTVPQLTDAMVEAGPAAASLGLSLEETASVLAGFAAKGVKGAKAGTAFRMILTRLARPPADAAKALRFLGVSVYDSTGEMRPMVDVLKDMQSGMDKLTGAQKAAVLKAIAGEEAFSKLGGLLEGNLDILSSWQEELKTGGAMELAFSQKMEAVNEQARLLWISVKNLAISIGQPLLGSLSGAAGWLARVLQAITGFTRAHPILGKLIGVTLAVVGVFGLLAGGVLTVTGMLGLFALKWLPMASAGMSAFSGIARRAIPTLLGWGRALLVSARAGRIHSLMAMDVGKAVKGLTGATWGALRAFLAWTGATAKDLAVKAAHAASVVAGTVATWASAAASKAAAAAQWLWNAAMTANPIGLVIAGVAALVTGVVLLIRNWDAVTGAVKRAFSWFRDLLGKAPDWVLALVFPLGLLIKHFDKVKAVATGVFGTLKSAVSSVAGWIADRWDTVKKVLLTALGPIGLVIAHLDKIKSVAVLVTGAVIEGWEYLKTTATDVFGTIASIAASAFQAVHSVVSTVFDWIADKVAWVTGKVDSVLGVLGSVGDFFGLSPASPGGGIPTSGRTAVPATAPSTESARALPAPRPIQETSMPALALAGAGGPIDQSVTIQPGAIQIHAVKVDEQVVRQIDFELAKLIRRRQERR